MNAQKVIETPIGLLRLAENGEALTAIERIYAMPQEQNADTPLLTEAQRQIDAYFEKKLTAFDLPLAMAGTAFEQSVWQALREIPFGEIRTYGQIAARLGTPKASRAVGRGCSRNPLLIVVPCHRVVAGTGKLTGFAAGMDAKRALLELEGKRIQGDRVFL